MKIIEKGAFNIASEASYVYILNGQKFIKNAKIENSNETFFWRFSTNVTWRKITLSADDDHYFTDAPTASLATDDSERLFQWMLERQGQ